MKKLIEKNWDYTLFQRDDNSLLLSVVCGNVGIYIMDIPLNTDETTLYHEYGAEYIEKLAEIIVKNSNAEHWQSRDVNK